ncbi:MAG TPA: AarF/UbiB family protein [Pyrinomonadaceae bacterium]|jgi:ubiquinone biosynthesis protein
MSDAVEVEEPTVFGRLVHGPVGFRRLLERLGPTFIKVGQFLAMRADVMPQRYCDELMGLLDRVPPFPWEQARAILKEDLGAEPTALFDFINPSPVAGGSLAQTHLARLKDGTEVAVKILRPGIKEKVERDLKRARLLARVLDLSGATLVVDPREVVGELAVWLHREIDFEQELSNLERLYRLAKGSAFERIPRPYPEFSGPRVVTSEYLRGVPVSEMFGAGNRLKAETAGPLADPDIDRGRFAENLLRSTLRQIFRYQFFHADLHPGNLIAMPGDVVGFVDFGLCDVLDEDIREGQMRYLAAVYDGEVEQIYRATLEVLDHDEHSDMIGFRTSFLAETREWVSRRRERSGDDGVRRLAVDERSPVARWMVGVMRAAHRNRLRVPTKVLLMYRALITAETVARQLDAETDLGLIGRRFFERLRVDEALGTLDEESARSSLFNTVRLLRDAPGQLQSILSELAENRFTVNVAASRTARERRERYSRARLLVSSICCLSVACLLAVPDLPLIYGLSSRWPLGGLLAILYLWTANQWRRLR